MSISSVRLGTTWLVNILYQNWSDEENIHILKEKINYYRLKYLREIDPSIDSSTIFTLVESPNRFRLPNNTIVNIDMTYDNDLLKFESDPLPLIGSTWKIKKDNGHHSSMFNYYRLKNLKEIDPSIESETIFTLVEYPNRFRLPNGHTQDIYLEYLEWLSDSHSSGVSGTDAQSVVDNSYNHKYLKYKSKYLNLKNIVNSK